MKPSYLDEQFGDRLTKLLKLKSRNKQLEILSDIYEEAEANSDYDDHEDAIQEYKEELREKINKIHTMWIGSEVIEKTDLLKLLE